MVKVGVIGKGQTSERYAEACANIEGVRFAGHAETWERLVVNGKPDLAVICASDSNPAAMIREAAAQGVHVLGHAPALSHDEIAVLQEFCGQAGVRFYPAYPLRHIAPYAKAKERIDRGELGRIGIVRMLRTGALPGDGRHLEKQEDLAVPDGDSWMHEVEWLCSCFGEAERVYARAIKLEQGAAAEAYATVTLRFAQGTIAYIQILQSPYADDRSVLEAFGDRGSLKLDTLEMASMYRFGGGEASGRTRYGSPLGLTPYLDIVRAAVNPMRANGTEEDHGSPQAAIEAANAAAASDAARALRVCAAIARSCGSGLPVAIGAGTGGRGA